MSYNILLNPVFEPHINRNNALPYIYHTDLTCGKRIANYHENLELLYFLDGCGTVQINDTIYEVAEHDLIVVNSYRLHQVNSTDPIRFFCLIIDSSFCKYHSIDCSKLYFSEKIKDPQIAALMQNIMSETTISATYQELSIQISILNLLLALCRNYARSATFTEADQYISHHKLQAAVSYIKEHISEKMTVYDIAQTTGLSQYHFMREFKNQTGLTVVTYINLLRCEYAKKLLLSKEYNLKEIAFLCGYDTDAYFCSVFKKHTGLSPSGYINRITQFK